MLVQDPKLVRVRLELARTFFLKGDDRLAKRHFEQVLAGGVPQAVAYNIARYLSTIRARRRWDMHAGFSIAPDTNIGASSDERIIYINVGGARLPFTRDAEELTTSGIGLSFWTAASISIPLRNNLRMRAGANTSIREYEGRRFDQIVPVCPPGSSLASGPHHGGELPCKRAKALERRSDRSRRPRDSASRRATASPTGSRPTSAPRGTTGNTGHDPISTALPPMFRWGEPW